MITLYSRTGCQPCRLTRRWLEQRTIPFTYVDIDVDDGAANEIAATQGIRELPIVVTADQTWGGFRPDLLEAHAH